MSVTGNPLQPTIFERSRPGRGAGTRLPAPRRTPSIGCRPRPAGQGPRRCPRSTRRRSSGTTSHLSPAQLVVDTGFYPLGSCTMKYNPKVERAGGAPARLRRRCTRYAARRRPPRARCELLYEAASSALAEICGMDAVTLQPPAGAHGELTA